ncbi:MAG: response regulator [Dehalococcoidaceae bacterium]|nr:response regulator [Dehalococcoidaceae bacterium]
MKNAKVMIVDDEYSIRHFLQVALSSQGYRVVEASSGNEALLKIVEEKPEAIILDLGLPDIDGIEVTRMLREWTQIPIIILSVRGSENAKVKALDAGADDYLTKPFGVGELLARLRVALRRSIQVAGDPVYSFGWLTVDLSMRMATIDNREVQLTPNEYNLLKVLVQHAGKVLTHRHLLNEVWGYEYGNEFHMLHVNISNLRRKIEPDPKRPQLVITEPGVGYRLRISE